jgi:Tfp pilus assembly protein PilX
MRTNQRGVALIMVILVLLVLTVLGITAAMLMTQEDRISSRQDLQKAALYAAEVGLRRGEAVFSNVDPVTNANINALLQHPTSASSAVTKAAPDERPVQPPAWDLRHLGTYLTSYVNSSVELANQEVVQRMGGQPFLKARTFYSLYVRNNPEDFAGGVQSPTADYDFRLRLISVGFVTDSNGVDSNGNAHVLAAKILEEEFNFQGASHQTPGQIGGNPGSTNSGVYAGVGQVGGAAAGP